MNTRLAVHRLPAEPTVLIVNGDPAMRALLEAIINAAGLHVVAFETAADYFGWSGRDHATCAILDVTLPDVSGLELQEQLAQKGTPAVFVTAHACITSCVRALKAGAVDFLTVPWQPHELLNAVHNAIAQALLSRAEHEQFVGLRSRFELLTHREREVFALVASGLLNKQVAQDLDISEITVQIHRSRVMKKMSARSFAALVRMADALKLPCAGSQTRSDWRADPIPLRVAPSNRQVVSVAFQ